MTFLYKKVDLNSFNCRLFLCSIYVSVILIIWGQRKTTVRGCLKKS